MKRIALAFCISALLVTTTLAARPADDFSDRAFGEINGKAMRDAAFAERAKHFVQDHGIGHPLRANLNGLSPIDAAKAAINDEVIRGRTPADWVKYASPEGMRSLYAQPQPADLVTEVVRLNALAGESVSPADIDVSGMPDDAKASFASLVRAVADAYEIANGVHARTEASSAWGLIMKEEDREVLAAAAKSIIAAQNAYRLTAPQSAATFRDPNGFVILGSSGNDAYERTGLRRDPILIVDPAGDDVYRTTAGAACPDLLSIAFDCNGLAVSTVLDLGGNDAYDYNGVPTIAQGAGAFGGIGVLYDADGDDSYKSKMTRGSKGAIFMYIDNGAQGYGAAGVGILLDAAGEDDYRAEFQSASGLSIYGFGQGTGAIGGLGLLSDAAGDDEYLAYGLSSNMRSGAFQGIYLQGMGDYAGVGILYEAGASNDHYHAWDVATTTDFYSVGFGGLGGLGIFYEDGGDDNYSTGEEATASNPAIVPLLNCAFGTGSLAGVGIMLEMGGNDIYYGDTISPRSAVTQNEGYGGPGESYGLFVDVSGDDGHFMYAHAGPGHSAQTFGRGILVVDFGALLLGPGGNMAGTYLDLGGFDQYAGASPSRDNAVWQYGADINAGSVPVLLPN